MRRLETHIGAPTQEVIIGRDRPVVVIGERINPTGRSGLSEALRRGDMAVVQRDGLAQAAAGADILDVNVGVTGIDQCASMAAAVLALQEVTDLPLCIDSPDPAVLQAGLTAYRGRALVNSVNGEERSLGAVLPLVKVHGAAVIALAMDDQGIPATPEARLRVAETILERAAGLGIAVEDVILDPLAMAVGADSGAARVTLETIRLFRERLGANVTLGVSNVSHGLPARPALNAVLCAMAIAAGVTCPIVNPLDTRMMETVRAASLLLGQDEWAAGWIRAFRATRKPTPRA
jgi:5-methyltetrahydrofolate--homocysteine methyltransferase